MRTKKSLTLRDKIALKCLKSILTRAYHDTPVINVKRAFEHADEFLKQIKTETSQTYEQTN